MPFWHCSDITDANVWSDDWLSVMILTCIDVTCRDGNEVSVLGLRCAETFPQMQHSPLSISPDKKQRFCSVNVCGEGECGSSDWLICVHIWKYTGAHGFYMYRWNRNTSCIRNFKPVRQVFSSVYPQMSASVHGFACLPAWERHKMHQREKREECAGCMLVVLRVSGCSYGGFAWDSIVPPVWD